MYFMDVNAPAQIITAPAPLIAAPAQPPATGVTVFMALFLFIELLVLTKYSFLVPTLIIDLRNTIYFIKS